MKISSRIIAIIASVAVVGSGGLMYYLSTKESGEVLGWMNSSWLYRKAIEVDNSYGVEISNEDVLIEIDTQSLISTGKMQDDCDDIRIVDSDDSTILNHWIQRGCNTSTTRIWVRIPTLPSNGKTIYIYYGNSSATNIETYWPISFVDLGTGADGVATVNASTNISTSSLVGRSCADAVSYNVSSLTSTTATVSAGSIAAGCLTAGDEILLIKLAGTTSTIANLGNYETIIVESIDNATGVVTFSRPKTFYYGDITDDLGLGTADETHRVMLQRVPNYSSLTITNGYTLSTDAWGGSKGGVLFIRVSGTVEIDGVVSAAGSGYRGGSGGSSHAGGGEGEGASRSATSNGNGGGNYPGAIGQAGLWSGGGGGGKSGTATTGNAGGAATTNYSSSGGGGGGASRQPNSSYAGYAGYGGGGGHATGGIGGVGGGTGANAGGSGTVSSSGAGGSSKLSTGNNRGGGGGGGSARYGNSELSILTMGGGGGGGGEGQQTAGPYYSGKAGANGGGIVYIAGNTINIDGSITTNGNTAPSKSAGSSDGGGGGGAGGSVKLQGNSVYMGTNIVTASGGGSSVSGSTNGVGGQGRIAVQYVSLITGTTSPSANIAQLRTPQSIYIQEEERYNNTPTDPTSLQTEGSTNPIHITTLVPKFTAIFNDPDEENTGTFYRIQVNTNQTFDDVMMWDSTKTEFPSPITNGARSSDISYSGTTLAWDTTYYWKVKFWDNYDGESNWSEVGQFTMNYKPNQPSSLETESLTNPGQVIDTTPEFTAIYVDTNSGDTSVYYRIEVNTASDFLGTSMWDSTKTEFPSPITNGDRSSEISYSGTTLEWSSTYYWRIKLWDNYDAESDWSATAQFTMNMEPDQPSSILIDGEANNQKTSSSPIISAVFSDDNASDTGGSYQVEVNTSSDFSGTVLWDSTKTTFGTPITNGARSSDIIYEGDELEVFTTNYLRIKFWDNHNVESEWSETANFILSSPPNAPTGLTTDGRTNPTSLYSKNPEFSAIYSDINEDSASAYRIQVNSNTLFTGTIMWDSGKTSTTILNGERSPGYTYNGLLLSNSNTIYYWRIRFWNTDDVYSSWSATAQFTDSLASFKMEGIKLDGIKIY